MEDIKLFIGFYLKFKEQHPAVRQDAVSCLCIDLFVYIFKEAVLIS